MTSDLIEFAAEQQRTFDAATSPEERKQRGHFGTAPAIAQFMAGMFSELPADTARVLDPGAGVGILSAAVCQRALQAGRPRRLSCELWENDPQLAPYLTATMERCRRALHAAGLQFEYTLRQDDFILARAPPTLFDAGPQPAFDLAIMNPPYFKLRKDSPHARAMAHVVHGQPNIYALFLAAAAEQLLRGGQLVAITPRSYFNGPYFKRFRQWFLDRLAVRQIHVFGSRTEAFRDDAVLQENVILWAAQGEAPPNVILTTTPGRDFDDVRRSDLPYSAVVATQVADSILRIAANPGEAEILATLDALPQRFGDLGLEISTGPVVSFRSTAFLRSERARDTAPLLWMHNVRPFVTQFPPPNGKPCHIHVSNVSRRLLVPARRYVLLKRFTAKEERRRLVAGIVDAADSYSPWLGLENHLNYIYRRNAELTTAEAFGLAAFLNSALVDRYFRAISGNTQVNASEIRSMPVPDAATLTRLGEEIGGEKSRDSYLVERAVGRALRLPTRLVDGLCEALE